MKAYLLIVVLCLGYLGSEALDTLPSERQVSLSSFPWKIVEGFPGNDARKFNGVASLLLDSVTSIRPDKVFGWPAQGRLRTVTLFTVFDLPAPLKAAKPQTLFINTVGDNFAIYVNGVPVLEKLSPIVQGAPQFSHVQRKLAVPIPANLFQATDNSLVIKMVGNERMLPFAPSFWYRFGGPIYLTHTEDYLADPRTPLRIGVLMIYLFFGLYHLVLFARRRHEHYNIYFAFLTGCILMQGFFNTNFAYVLFPNSRFALVTLIVSASLLMPAIALYTYTFFYSEQKIPRLLKAYLALAVILALPIPFLAVNFISVLATFMQMGLGTLFVVSCAWILYRVVRDRKEDALVAATGMILLLASMMLFFFLMRAIGLMIPLHEIGTFFWIMGLVVLMANRHTRIHNASDRHNAQLQLVLAASRELASCESVPAALRCALGYLVDETPCLRQASGYFLWESGDKFQRTHLALAENGLTDGCVLPMLLNDEAEGAVKESAAQVVDGRWLVVPVRSGQKWEGAFVFRLSGREKVLRDAIKGIDLRFCETLAASLGVALDNIHAIAEIAAKARFETALQAAQTVQSTLLPKEWNVPMLDVGAHYAAAEETGGDWLGCIYDESNDRVFLYIGDVTGHGIPAAMMTGVVHGALYASFDRSLSSEDALRHQLLRIHHVLRNTAQGQFCMTMYALCVHLSTGEVTSLNAGHPHPLLVKGANVRVVPGSGSLLGSRSDALFPARRFQLTPGDMLVLYTDGLIENSSKDGDVLERRAIKDLLAKGNESSSAAVQALMTSAQTIWAGHRPDDDTAVLALRWSGKDAQQVA